MNRTHGQLTATVRAGAGKGVARKLRAEGRLPAVMYGKGRDSILLAVDHHELQRAFDPERGLNTFFTVTIQGDGGEQVESCMIADSQMHPTRKEFVHVDFLRIDPDTAVSATVPVEYTGRAKGVASGGKLFTYRRTARISAKPAAIPRTLVVDVSELSEGDSLRLKSLVVPGVRLLDHPETVMASVDYIRGKLAADKPAAGEKPAADAPAAAAAEKPAAAADKKKKK